LNDSNSIGNATNRILKAIDELGDKLVLGESPRVRIVSNTTAVEVWNLAKVKYWKTLNVVFVGGCRVCGVWMVV
jgi:hypothetical protein